MKAVEVRNIKIGEGIPKICVPIVGVTKEDIINEAKTFENIPVDVVEWRVDWFENVFDIEKVKDVLTDLRQVLKVHRFFLLSVHPKRAVRRPLK